MAGRIVLPPQEVPRLNGYPIILAIVQPLERGEPGVITTAPISTLDKIVLLERVKALLQAQLTQETQVQARSIAPARANDIPDGR